MQDAKDSYVVAVMADHTTRVRCSNPLPWDAAQRMWRQLDDERQRGHMPHVAYYAVRSTDDPDWQGLKLDQATLRPAQLLGPMPERKPTSHQAEVLARLVSRSTGGRAPMRHQGTGTLLVGELAWVKQTSIGSEMGLWHLWCKGYAEQDVRMGPRGGEHAYYRPTMAGVAYVADQRLLAARRLAKAAA